MLWNYVQNVGKNKSYFVVILYLNNGTKIEVLLNLKFEVNSTFKSLSSNFIFNVMLIKKWCKNSIYSHFPKLMVYVIKNMYNILAKENHISS